MQLIEFDYHTLEARKLYSTFKFNTHPNIDDIYRSWPLSEHEISLRYGWKKHGTCLIGRLFRVCFCYIQPALSLWPIDYDFLRQDYSDRDRRAHFSLCFLEQNRQWHQHFLFFRFRTFDLDLFVGLNQVQQNFLILLRNGVLILWVTSSSIMLIISLGNVRCNFKCSIAFSRLIMIQINKLIF